MAKHQIMDHSGHSTIEFDRSNTVELKEAMERFEKLTKSGHISGTRNAGETEYTKVKDFKDTRDETIFTTARQAG